MRAFGLDVRDLPENYIPVDAVCVIKCLDEDGNAVLVTRGTDMRIWDSIGMLTVALDQERHDAVTAFERDDDGA